MQSIIGDINNGQLKNVYLLYGPEAYLRKQYRDKLRAASQNEDDTSATPSRCPRTSALWSKPPAW